MKKTLCLTAAFFALSFSYAYSHHPTYYIDETIYERIDLIVADTPHADLVFEDDMGRTPDNIMGEMDEDNNVITEETIETTTITTEKVQDVVDMVRSGILTNAAKLDGDVTINIDFTNEKSVTMTILQLEQE